VTRAPLASRVATIRSRSGQRKTYRGNAMRTLRLSLTGTAILMLLVAAGGSVAAQSEEPAEAAQAATPVVVSGTLECLGEAPADAASDAEPGTPTDGVMNLHKWESSDARFSGEVAYSGQWQLYEEPSEDSGSGEGTDTAVYAIVNEGGRWLCAESRALAPGDRAGSHTLLFSGEGAYEGMTAYLQVDWSQTPYAFNGIILPGDAPPYAEPQG